MTCTSVALQPRVIASNSGCRHNRDSYELVNGPLGMTFVPGTLIPVEQEDGLWFL